MYTCTLYIFLDANRRVRTTVQTSRAMETHTAKTSKQRSFTKKWSYLSIGMSHTEKKTIKIKNLLQTNDKYVYELVYNDYVWELILQKHQNKIL